ncbi:MAG: NAD(P)/FAD-dependent oxidoreductase [Parvularculaceae bacterium]
MTQPDVIIVGGGVIGLTTAYALVAANMRVTVIDSGAPSATNAAAGMLAPSFERALSASLAHDAFARASLDRWRDFAPLIEDESGVAIDFRQTGILSVAFADETAGAFPEDLQGGERLSGDEARALEPALSDEIAHASFAPGDGQIDPRALLRALEAALTRRGAAILRGVRVAAVEAKSGALSRVALSTGETIGAGAAVLATGASIDGAGMLAAGAVFPVKGEALALARIGGAPRHVIRTRSAYLCPKAANPLMAGRVIVGATEIPCDRSLAPDDVRIEALKAGAARAAPALARAAEIERWAGLRPATADGLPIIGRAPEGPSGLFYALGHYRNGVLLAPATADALTRLIVSGKAGEDIAAFSPARASLSALV